MNNLLRNSLLLLVLTLAQAVSAQVQVALRGPVGGDRLLELARSNPDMRALDLSEAVIEGNLIPAGVFAGSKLERIVLPATGSITIGDGAFMSSALTEIILPESVVAVGQGAFASCTELRSAVISGAEIGSHAFHLCSTLETAALGNSSALGGHAFEGCVALKKVEHNNALQLIGEHAFTDCAALQKFIFPAPLTRIGDHAFAHSGLIVADMTPCGDLQTVGAWAFASDVDLTVVKFPADAILGDGVLFNCPSIRHLELPAALKAVPAFAFTGSTGSNGYHRLPDTVETIGAMSYKDSDLGHIVLPAYLTEIGSHAMANTPRLAIIDGGNVARVPELGTDVWAGVDKSLVVLEVADELRDDFRNALQWQDFKIEKSGISDPETTPVDVRFAFSGHDLIIEAPVDIIQVEIYNESGACFLNSTLSSETVSIPTDGMNLRIFLVRCVLSDGTVATAKLSR